MDFSVISLIVLVVVVAIGFIKKVNLGFLSLGVAFILGTCGGMSAKEIANGFSASMFVTLGVTFLFGMASANGTLELFSKKVVALVGKNTVLIPVLMFFLSAFISAIGPGHIAAGILMTTFAMYLAFEMDINPIATALFAKLGANAGCTSPLSLTGVLAKSLGDPLGYSGFGLHLFLTTLISGFLFTLILYIGFKSLQGQGGQSPEAVRDSQVQQRAALHHRRHHRDGHLLHRLPAGHRSVCIRRRLRADSAGLRR